MVQTSAGMFPGTFSLDRAAFAIAAAALSPSRLTCGTTESQTRDKSSVAVFWWIVSAIVVAVVVVFVTFGL